MAEVLRPAPRDRNDFRIAIICALKTEFDAVEGLFDHFWEGDQKYGKADGDPNAYSTGRIGEHDVVLAFMPGMGNLNSANTSAALRSSFGGIRLGLVVGVCAGAPYTPEKDPKEIILGDVIISTGVVQSDFGREYSDQIIIKDTLEDSLGRPNVEIRSFLRKLSGIRAGKQLREGTYSYLLGLLKQEGYEAYGYPGAKEDTLYKSEYRHKHHAPYQCDVCFKCENDWDPVCTTSQNSTCAELHCNSQMLIDRQRLQQLIAGNRSDKLYPPPVPNVHMGRISSAGQTKKTVSGRDKLAKEKKIIGFEMEGAGVWDNFPTVVIKGVCDYGDSHKNKIWQNYAAAAAAACMKAFLAQWTLADRDRPEVPLSNLEKRDVYDRIQLTNPSSLHNTASALYEKGTGEWVFRTPEWDSWLSKSDKRCLWVHGIPGSGKTVLMSHIINHVEHSWNQTTNNGRTCLVYYYCYFGHNQNEVAPMLRWVISQLSRKADIISARVHALVNTGIEPKLSDLLDALEDTLRAFDKVYLAIDALDETTHIMDLLNILYALATENRFQKLQLLVTSREYHDIERVIKPVCISVSLSNDFVAEDIRVYLESAIQNDRHFSHPRWTFDLLQLIIDLLPRKANGMFRWAVCQLDVVRKLRAESSIIRRYLDSLPQTLYEMYERIFNSIGREHWPAVQCALRWIYLHQELYAKSIPSETVVQAIYYENPGASNYFYDEDSLRDAMGCLVRLSQVEPFKTFPDKFSCPAFSFAHHTVFEFLTSSRIDNSDLRFFKLSPTFISEPISTLLKVATDQTSYAFNTTSRTFSSLIYKDFTWYCAVSVLFAIATFPGELIPRYDLHPLIWKLLEPTEQHFERFRELCIWTEDSALIFSEHDMFDTSLLSVEWLHVPPPSSRTISFFHLANLQREYDMSGLVSVFMDELIHSSGLEKLDLVISAHFRGTGKESFRFTGSIPEVLAEVHVLLNQLESLTYQVHSFIEEELVDYEKLLLLRICANLTNPIIDEDADHIFIHLLQKVNPDSIISSISALQIAVACCDYRSTRLLLGRGADPNFMSTSCENVWDEESPLVVFDRFRYRSPLRICQSPDQLRRDLADSSDRDEQVRMRIEALLIEKGARSFDLEAD